MLKGLQQMHEKTLLFIDLKPENFMLGLPEAGEGEKVGSSCG